MKYYKIYLALFGLLIFTLEGFGQSPLILNQAITIGDYIDREEIKAVPGFSATTAVGDHVSLAIDPIIISSNQYNSSSSTGIPSVNKDIDYSLPVGSIKSNYQVTATGSLDYSIPIVLPPGTHEIIPQINLQYNSQAGYGILGQGWSLNGLSSIVRTGTTLYHNSNLKPIEYENTDWFAFDGNKLLPTVGANGEDNTVYRTEIESYGVVTSYGMVNGSPEWFEVKNKDGITIELGRTSDSKFTPLGKNAPLIWMVNKVHDNFGNYISFEYDVYNNEIYISKIKYTGNDNIGMAPYNIVEFKYGFKPESSKIYINNGAVSSSLILQEIKIRSEQKHFKSYKFNYSTYHIYSFLIDVEEYGSDYSKLNSLAFSYLNDQGAPLSVTPTINFIQGGNLSSSYPNVKYFPLDYDGDGRKDLIAFYGENLNLPEGTLVSWQRYSVLHNDNGSFTEVSSYNYPGGTGFPSDFRPVDLFPLNKSSMGNMIMGTCDFNGDGFEDLSMTSVFQPNITFNVHTSNGVNLDMVNPSNTFSTTVTFDVWTPQSNTQIPTNSNNVSLWEVTEGHLSSTDNKFAIRYIDMNGDTKLDILTYVDISTSPRNSTVKVWFEAGSSSTFLSLDAAATFNFDNAFPMDIDGDGKAELSNIYNNDATAQFPQGYYFLKYIDGQLVYVPDLTNTPPFTFTVRKIYFGDFNADGISDMIYCDYIPTLRWKLKLGMGNGYYEDELLPTSLGLLNPFDQGSNPANHTDSYYFTQDVNNDGKTDFIELAKDYSSGITHINIYYCTGSEFRKEACADINYLFDNLNDDLNFGDFNGDGTQDIIVYHTGWNSFSNVPTIIYLYKGCNTRYLTEAVNGYNAKTTFEYGSLNDPSCYSQAQAFSFPLNNLNGALKVVTKISTPDGVGGNAIKRYSYSDGLFHRNGKGFLGFLSITSDDYSSKIRQVDRFELNSQYFVLSPKSTIISNLVNGVVLSEEQRTYTFTNTFSPIGYSMLPCSISVNKFPLGISKITSYYYDAYGNLISQTENVNNNYQISETQSTYILDGAPLPSKPEDVTIYSMRQGQPSVTRTTHFEYQNGLVKREIADQGTIGSTTTEYIYDPNSGVLLNKKLSASGLVNRNYSLEWDPKFRFVLKETNPLGQIVERQFNPLFGKVIYTKDVNGLITRVIYDGFGDVVKTMTPDGAIINTKVDWMANSTVFGDDKLGIQSNILFFINQQTTNKPSEVSYYDILSRQIQRETDGFADKIIKQTAYDQFGNVESETGNYYNGTTDYLRTRYYYQDVETPNQVYKMETTEGSHVNQTLYSYSHSASSSTVITTNPQGYQSIKTSDCTGKLIAVQDFGNGQINYGYTSSGLQNSISVNGIASTSMTYDLYGNQMSLQDKNSGTTYYTYDAFKQLLSETDNNINIKDDIQYDQLGRLTHYKVRKNALTYEYNFNYNLSGNGINKLNSSSVMSPSGLIEEHYLYDSRARIVMLNKVTGGQSFSTQYEYDADGNLVKTIYPGGVGVVDVYNSKGYISEMKSLKNGSIIWKGSTVNSFGKFTKYTLADQVETTIDYDGFCFPKRIYAPGMEDMNYQFDQSSGNLNARQDYSSGRNLNEIFTYDQYNRLLTSQVISPTPLPINTIQYHPTNATIFNKSDAGSYSTYAALHPDAPENITSLSGNIPTDPQTFTWTPFNKLNSIVDPNYNLSLVYGVDQERIKSTLVNSASITTRYYLPGYEKIIQGNSTVEVYYFKSPSGLCGMLVNDNGVEKMYSVYTDYLGSILKVTDGQGNNLEQNFDAWGRSRNANNWTYTGITTSPIWLTRGFTGHEHMREFGLVNMNGRIYDPVLGVALSPDNYIQNPDNATNFNRYSYCLNNPLSFVDEDGNCFWLIFAIAAFIGGGYNVSQHWDQISNNPVGIFAAFITGAAVGGGSVILGAATLGAATGVPLSSIIAGSAPIGATFGAAFCSAALAAGTGAMVLSISNNAMFHDPMIGLSDWMTNMFTAGITAGLLNGVKNIVGDRGFFSGVSNTSKWREMQLNRVLASNSNSLDDIITGKSGSITYTRFAYIVLDKDVGYTTAGTYNVNVSYSIYQIGDKTDLMVNATGFTNANQVGKITWTSHIDVLNDGKLLYSKALIPGNYSTIIQNGWGYIGSAEFQLPATGIIQLNMSFCYSIDYELWQGSGVPITHPTLWPFTAFMNRVLIIHR